jgi:mannose-1-phosphate guanylyltransferase
MPVNAVIIVGGPSTVTDFRPLSLYQPKPLFPIAGRPLIYHHLKALAALHDLQEVFLVGYYEASQFTAFMEEVRQELKIRIRYLREFEPLGTGGGLYHFRDQIQRGEPDSIIFMHMDVCCTFPLPELLAFHREKQRSTNGKVIGSILSTRVPKDVAKNFGCMVVDPESRQVRHYVEKPETNVSDLISCGIYVFSNLIFDEVRRAVLESELKYLKIVSHDI